MSNRRTNVHVCPLRSNFYDSSSTFFGMNVFKSQFFFVTITDETDLLLPLDNDDWLIRFLRPCKFYASSARDLVSSILVIVHIK